MDPKEEIGIESWEVLAAFRDLGDWEKPRPLVDVEEYLGKKISPSTIKPLTERGFLKDSLDMGYYSVTPDAIKALSPKGKYKSGDMVFNELKGEWVTVKARTGPYTVMVRRSNGERYWTFEKNLRSDAGD